MKYNEFLSTREVKRQMYDMYRDRVRGYDARTKEEHSIMREFKAYIAEHRDLLFTVFLLFLADSWLLHGALRGRLESMCHKILDKAEQSAQPATPAARR